MSPTRYLLQRVMPHAAMHFGRRFQIFFQLTSNLVWGRDPRPLDRDDLDVLQAFASFSLGSFTVRGGRQEVQYAQLAAGLDPGRPERAPGVRRPATHSAHPAMASGRLRARTGGGAARRLRRPFRAGTMVLGRLCHRARVPTGSLGLDLYYLGRFRETAAFEQGTARELRHTIGTRIWGAPDRLRLQRRGRLPGGDVRRRRDRRLDARVGRGLHRRRASGPAPPRAQTNATSGDSNPSSADLPAGGRRPRKSRAGSVNGRRPIGRNPRLFFLSARTRWNFHRSLLVHDPRPNSSAVLRGDDAAIHRIGRDEARCRLFVVRRGSRATKDLDPVPRSERWRPAAAKRSACSDRAATIYRLLFWAAR